MIGAATHAADGCQRMQSGAYEDAVLTASRANNGATRPTDAWPVQGATIHPRYFPALGMYMKVKLPLP